ncbi:diacylglycerol kinase family protein [Candidatus Gottesmanbacteria bacterium]|nr:diacylglycerol kinase family protein [Candidatus Gottesmanbacteria bacterium]
MEALRRHHISFKNAFAGLWWSFKTQPNFRVHFSLALISLLAGWYFQISYLEMAIIIFAIFFGLAMEMVNTSIEEMTDLITTEWRKEAKIAKDVSAGMMLLSALATVIIAALILLPRIAEKFF